MMASHNLESSLSRKYAGIQLWALITMCLVGVVVCLLLIAVFMWLTFTKKSKSLPVLPVSQFTPNGNVYVPEEEIKEIRVDQVSASPHSSHTHRAGDKELPDELVLIESASLKEDAEEEGSSSHSSPLSGLPQLSHLGWGLWFTLRDLQEATNRFSKDHIIGTGGYGVVYRGQLFNGTHVAVKRLLNNQGGQADKDFRVEVEAIGHVRHRNLVRLLGYCMEGTQRMLVYEYVNNGNLEQWLHGNMGATHGYLTWEVRMKILLGTAKALAYLHEAIEPKVVHRDIKSSNILIDDNFEPKISDFGLAKLLGAGKTHITTRVMGTFGYVAPEYANSGLLNEKSDIYSFGVVVLELITGRDPVDYARPENEVNLVEWLKMMISRRRSEEVLDPLMENRPSTSALKRVLLTSLRCLDPSAEKRPKMSQVVRMLESEEYPISKADRRRKSDTRSIETGVTEAFTSK